MSQPVLGILTLYLNDKKRLEERHVYQKMIIEGAKLGLDVYVFTPMDIHGKKSMIHALIYDPGTRTWSRKWREFPDLIYDRCRIQRSKRFEQLKQFRHRYGHLRFLNRPLRDKWTIYQLLSRKASFRSYLPETVLFQNSSDPVRLLHKHSSIYVKPINGTGGRGILRLERLENNMVLVQGRRQNRSIIPAQKLPISRLGSLLHNWKGSSRFIAQQAIHIKLPDGKVHDYRMLVQKNGEGQWEVTGGAGRVGPARSVTSNLHGGGRAIPMNRLLSHSGHSDEKRSQIRRTAEKLSLEVAEYLESSIGAICELALDLAIDRSGSVYILEVNPKPAREVFMQTGDKEAYRRAIIKPLEYALWLYNRKAAPSSS
ncbi:YheC/YheD family endospore coat-associated protein [Paenibacillus antibioticophila]|uniref:YheC/YheD family endospore coat-associated protein n=1 Tax=Paenibacillus antibioticophila TaxID=1274374 RepID=UPI0005C8CC64|nr:YheC/YheD family protein [Paenibacillus antibioticophila]